MPQVHAPTTTDANRVDDPRANATAAAAAAAEHSLHAEGVDDVSAPALVLSKQAVEESAG